MRYKCGKVRQIAELGIRKAIKENDARMAVRHQVFRRFDEERQRQISKWGQQDHCNVFWLGILAEEVAEIADEVMREMEVRLDGEPVFLHELADLYVMAREIRDVGRRAKAEIERDKYQGDRHVPLDIQQRLEPREEVQIELIQSGAVCVAWLEAIERRRE